MSEYETKSFDRFLGIVAHRFIGARSWSCSIMGRITLPFEKDEDLKYLRTICLDWLIILNTNKTKQNLVKTPHFLSL